MSTDFPTGPVGARSTMFRMTVLVMALCLLLPIPVYFLWIKDHVERQRESQANQEKVQEISTGLSEAKQREEETKSAIATLKDKLDSQAITSEQLDELLVRLKAVEAGRMDQAEALRGLSQQANAVAGERARDRARIIEAAKTGEQAQAELKELEQELTAWVSANAMLPNGEVGQKIGQFPDLVERYAVLQEMPAVDFSQADRWEEQLAAVYPRIKAAYEKDEFLTVTEEDQQFLARLLGDVQAARQTVKQRQRALYLIIAQAQDSNPGQQTLEEALAARQADRDAAHLEQLVKAKQQATEKVDAEYAEKIAAEQQRQREIINQQKLRAVELETEQQKKELNRIDALADAAKKAREKEKLLDDFNREQATITSVLAPFLDLAITQPAGTNPIGKGGIRRPTSLGALRASGALEETREGLDFLYHVGGHPANMRKKGSFPSFVSISPIPNDSVRQSVRRAQDLLNKYGDLLVEKGLLSP